MSRSLFTSWMFRKFCRKHAFCIIFYCIFQCNYNSVCCACMLSPIYNSCIGYHKIEFIFPFHLCARNERGTYHALDLGSTNLRVLRVQLDGTESSVINHNVKRKPIPEHLMTSTIEVTESLFKFDLSCFWNYPVLWTNFLFLPAESLWFYCLVVERISW